MSQHRCAKCARDFPSASAYQRHVKKVHGGRAPLSNQKKLAILVAALVVIAAVVVAVSFARESRTSGTAEERFHVSSSPHLGNGTVKLIAFESPNCPSCRLFHRSVDGQPSTLQLIVERYVDSGRLTYVEKTMFINEPWEERGAAAQKCVWNDQPALFWPLTEAIYASQDRISEATLDRFLSEWAVSVGYDEAKLLDCTRANPHNSQILQDLQDGRRAGVRGTPTFIVVAADGSTQTIVGPQPFSVFQGAIENAFITA